MIRKDTTTARWTDTAGLRFLVLAALLVVATVQFGTTSTAAVAAARHNSSAGPCGISTGQPARYDHVIWITFENSDFSSIIGNAKLPYLNQMASNCGVATQFFGEGEPSLPNYLAMVSGSTQGIDDDRDPPSPLLSADNLYHQVKSSGRQWRHYASKMPRNCDRRDWPSSSAPFYAVHHEAAPYFADIAADCSRWMVPLGSPSAGAFVSDLRSGSFPAFAVIGPADDGGRASGGEVDPCCLDRFLRSWLPLVFASSEYRQGRTAIFITWDENGVFDHSATPEHIPTVVIAPSVRPHTRSNTHFTHYSMLRTTEQLLGIRGYLGRAAGATSMRAAFHL